MRFIDEDAMKDKHGIYKITNITNNMVYIGQTMQRFQKRYWHHQWKLNNGTHDNQHLQNAWNLYGDDAFEFSVVETIEDYDNDNLDELEIQYIKYYKELGCCYNISDGGCGIRGVERTDEWKRKIGEKNRVNMLGKRHTEETRKKMSKSHKGKHLDRNTDILNDGLAFNIKTRLINGEKPSNIARDLDITYNSVNGILSNNTWSNVYVDGWDEWRNNRKTWTRLTPEDHKEIYRLHTEEGYTKYKLADMYHKGVKMIEKIFRECRKSIEQNEQDNHMTIQCQAS